MRVASVLSRGIEHDAGPNSYRGDGRMALLIFLSNERYKKFEGPSKGFVVGRSIRTGSLRSHP
jgi:hypothetical protein